MANSASLLPPNAKPLEHALATATARIGDIPRPLLELWRPDAIPLAILAWLAWGLAVDRWRQEWSEAQKRAATAQAIPNARIKGSRGAAMAVLADYSPSLTLTEWFEEGGSGEPYTFFVTVPLDADPALNSAAFAQDVYNGLIGVKPARAHFKLRQRAIARTTLPMTAASRAWRYDRYRAQASYPTEYLLSESAQILQAEDGQLMEIE